MKEKTDSHCSESTGHVYYTSGPEIKHAPLLKLDLGLPPGFAFQSGIPEHVLVDDGFVQRNVNRVPTESPEIRFELFNKADEEEKPHTPTVKSLWTPDRNVLTILKTF